MKRADWDKANLTLRSKLQALRVSDNLLDSEEAIDEQVKGITQAIQETIDESIPKSRPSKFAKPYWTKECSEAVKEALKARRYWTKAPSEDSWVQY